MLLQIIKWTSRLLEGQFSLVQGTTSSIQLPSSRSPEIRTVVAWGQTPTSISHMTAELLEGQVKHSIDLKLPQVNIYRNGK